MASVYSAAAAVHPRVCGERNTAGAVTAAGNGSSPRVRGTRDELLAHRVDRRFIPACAGNALEKRIGLPEK